MNLSGALLRAGGRKAVQHRFRGYILFVGALALSRGPCGLGRFYVRGVASRPSTPRRPLLTAFPESLGVSTVTVCVVGLDRSVRR
jgi:hypothetical protein